LPQVNLSSGGLPEGNDALGEASEQAAGSSLPIGPFACCLDGFGMKPFDRR
jgi:hypothetical protein